MSEETIKQITWSIAVLMLLGWILFACAAPNITTPHDARCVDGLHTHKETK